MEVDKLMKPAAVNALQGIYKLQQEVKLVWSGQAYFKLMISIINNAKKCIHIQVYIFNDDETGILIAGCLKNAAKRGVKIYLLIDGYASQGLSEKLIDEMKSAGISINKFEPLFRSKKFYLGRRLHHKVIVADGVIAMVGGLNIADRYNDTKKGDAWLDMALYIKGVTACELEQVCCEIWNDTAAEKIKASLCTEKASKIAHPISVRIRRNDWVKGKNQIVKSYINMIANAHDEITICSSYFLPGWRIRNQLSAAAKRGVIIHIMLGSKSDVMISKPAERYLYNWLFSHGIKVYEYQKNILHTKATVADNKWMTIGSYNVNNISSYASMELNLDVRNKPFVTNVNRQLKNIISTDCIEITPENYRMNTNVLKQLWYKCCYEMIKFLFFLFTFYFRQEKLTHT